MYEFQNRVLVGEAERRWLSMDRQWGDGRKSKQRWVSLHRKVHGKMQTVSARSNSDRTELGLKVGIGVAYSCFQILCGLVQVPAEGDEYSTRAEAESNYPCLQSR